MLSPYLNTDTVNVFFEQFEKEVDPDLPPGVVPISMLVQQVLNGLLMRAKRSGAILSSEDRLG